MLWFFFDRIFEDILSGNHRGVISSLTILEFISAIRRKVESEEINWKEFIDTVMCFLKEISENFVVEAVDSPFYADALDYVIKYSLKASDSIQISCASRLLQTVEKSIYIVNSDDELSEALEMEGFHVIDPEVAKLEEIENILQD